MILYQTFCLIQNKLFVLWRCFFSFTFVQQRNNAAHLQKNSFGFLQTSLIERRQMTSVFADETLLCSRKPSGSDGGPAFLKLRCSRRWETAGVTPLGVLCLKNGPISWLYGLCVEVMLQFGTNGIWTCVCQAPSPNINQMCRREAVLLPHPSLRSCSSEEPSSGPTSPTWNSTLVGIRYWWASSCSFLTRLLPSSWRRMYWGKEHSLQNIGDTLTWFQQNKLKLDPNGQLLW